MVAKPFAEWVPLEGYACSYNHSLITKRPASYNDLVIRPLSCLLLAAVSLHAQKPAPFEIEEATIAQVHDAMKAGTLTCRALVAQYLKRIDAYDKNGPAINSIVILNPDAENQAADLDRRFAQSG